MKSNQMQSNQMQSNQMLLLKGDDILALLRNRELEIVQTVKSSYKLHHQGKSSLPHSSFLRFPNHDKNRIIALPAYLGGEFDTAGIKWIASFPDNVATDMERASATLILNSTQNGHAKVMMECSVISAKRTAASAALAASYLIDSELINTAGIIGCGFINFETVRFLLATCPFINNLLIYDLSWERAEKFKQKCQQLSERLTISIVEEPKAIFQNSYLCSLATTAIKPHIFELPEDDKNRIILHTSLRDLSPEIILSANNIVDDIDHVCRAQTSIHLAEQKTGNREFINSTIADLINDTLPQRPNNKKLTIFSPFGLGVLDLAIGELVYQLAIKEHRGTTIESFIPVPWFQRTSTPTH